MISFYLLKKEKSTLVDEMFTNIPYNINGTDLKKYNNILKFFIYYLLMIVWCNITHKKIFFFSLSQSLYIYIHIYTFIWNCCREQNKNPQIIREVALRQTFWLFKLLMLKGSGPPLGHHNSQMSVSCWLITI